MFDWHNVISVFYSVKRIMSFNKFYFRDFGRQLFQRYFRSNIAISKTSFWARPFKIEHAKLIVWLSCALKKLVLEVPMTAFLKKRMLKNCMAALITTEKRLQVLKATQIFVSFSSCFNGYLIFLCFRFSAWTVSFLRRLRGKEERNGPWEH